jgi:FAD/FMN-containing dehydrogenase
VDGAAKPVEPLAREELAAELARHVGGEHVVADPAVAASFGHDLTGRYHGRPLLVVSPADTAEVAAVLRACSAARVPVVPQGGHSGMVGGGTPRDGEVVLSLRRLDELGEIDRFAGQVTAGAGVVLERLQRHVREAGLDFAVDHGARTAATIGGMAATNAGGALAARHGMMRRQVAGLEAVLADGRVLTRLGGLVKDNAGYDLTGLLVGSEGTLAVITRVRLRLVPLLARRLTALLGVASLERALELLPLLQAVPSLEAVDFFELRGLRRVCAHLGLPPPFEREFEVYLVVECASAGDPSDELAEVAAAVDDVVASTDAEGRRSLWRYREAHNETVSALGVPHKLDVAVPVGSLPRFAREVRAVVGAVDPGAEVILFGHLGDGNVHVNVVGPAAGDIRVDRAVLELVAALGGSISAEHGIGVAKTEWLELTRSPAEVAALRAIKAALDPLGILAPGRLLAGPPSA